jgi:Ni,Fe-hydrogenase I large subunit
MATKIAIDPLTRIEGHLAIKLEIESGKVSKAYCAGEMFRGFEAILRGRSPMDAQQITQRICGVCPISHGMASLKAQEQVYGVELTDNGRLTRNLILGANYIQSHIVHFYQLSALDFVDITAILKYQGSDGVLLDLQSWVKAQLDSKSIFPASPFLPRYEGTYLQDLDINTGAIRHYVDALEMRAIAQEALALFGGKAPHATALIPGGITEKVTAKKIAAYAEILQRLRSFIERVYLPDVVAVAQAFPDYFQVGKGCGNFLAFGVFDQENAGQLLPGGRIEQGKLSDADPAKIGEDTTHALFSSPSGLHPYEGQTVPAPDKAGAYSWLKAPRYEGKPYEVGPLARMLIAHQKGHPKVKPLIEGALKDLGLEAAALDSVMGRHAARALECKIVADACVDWLDKLKPGQPTFADFKIPAAGKGAGLTEAPRGALGHWIEIAGHKIKNYQCVVPSTWNSSPRDSKGVAGPMEQALEGTPVADSGHPLEAARVVRSFDPCLACAVH